MEEIKKRINIYILQSLNNPGVDIETNKFDFKYEWYNLKDQKGINEFLKDTTAIINSYGGSDGFMVFGFNPKEKFKDASFKDSGLRDKTDLAGLINSKVDKPFNIDEIPSQYEDHKISILHIPPSVDKPHVIRHYVSKENQQYQNAIFIRHSTGTKHASKHDLDLMYAEKKSIVIERQVNASINLDYIAFVKEDNNQMCFNGPIFLENIGMRKLAVTKVFLILTLLNSSDRSIHKRIIFASRTLTNNPLILDVNNFHPLRLKLFNEYDKDLVLDKLVPILNEYKKDTNYLLFESVELELFNGISFPANLSVLGTE